MAESSGRKTESKKHWALTQSAFHGLLNWLDAGEDSGGARYLEVRSRLVLYFDRKNCPSPDEMADETLNRVARRLEEEGKIISDAPAHYCYIVARFVFLEYLRNPEMYGFPGDEAGNLRESGFPASPGAGDEKHDLDKRLNCLSTCMEELDPDHRELIVDYYAGEQRAKINNRRAMAARLSITMNALSIRACRIRDRLEACVRTCMERR